jgi:hypothetical protein
MHLTRSPHSYAGVWEFYFWGVCENAVLSVDLCVTLNLR